ncbi:MAG: HAMP domain-containing histidine kinase, partial [Planctomycetes bacterium]|nr:HAMP domain-containing histidine kinase [Planctomycetota bacterium]
NGAGLGLAFCKKVIDSHDGTITVESKPGKGTTFRLTLPDADAEHRS